jgi:hypothetical protein
MTPDKLNTDRAFVMDEYTIGALSSLEVAYHFQPDQILAYTDTPLDTGIDIALGGGQGAGLIPLRGQGPASFPGLSPNQRLTLYNLDSSARTVLLIAQRGHLPLTVTAPVETISGPTMPNIGARVRQIASFSIPNAAFTSHPFTTEDYDTDEMHESTINPSRLTCVTAGLYLMGGNIWFAPHATGDRAIQIKYNGSLLIAEVYEEALSAVDWLITVGPTPYRMSVGDYVELQVYQSSGGALNSLVQQSATPVFWVQKIAD